MRDFFKNMPMFFAAFYQLHIIHDPKKAKKYFKVALHRSECAKGAFLMICGIYIESYLSGGS
jgi:hypothetical protein